MALRDLLAGHPCERREGRLIETSRIDCALGRGQQIAFSVALVGDCRAYGVCHRAPRKPMRKAANVRRCPTQLRAKLDLRYSKGRFDCAVAAIRGGFLMPGRLQLHLDVKFQSCVYEIHILTYCRQQNAASVLIKIKI